MLSSLFSLGVFYYTVSLVLAATPITQTSVLSENDLIEALSFLDGNTTSFPLPPTTNTSAIELSPILTSSLAAVGPVFCLVPQPPPQRRYNPVVVDDYLENLENIISRPTAMIVRTWNLGPMGKLVYIHKGCRIGLQVPYPPSPIQFPRIYVAHLASVIAKQCLTEEKGFLGGIIRFRVANEFNVILGAARDVPGAASS